MKQAQLPNPNQFAKESSLPFHQMLGQIERANFFEERLEIANSQYQLKHYKIMGLTPSKIQQLYQVLQKKVYNKSSEKLKQIWATHELKVFMWIVICHLGQQISKPEEIVLLFQPKSEKIWDEFSKIFNFKNTKLLQYQVKLLVNSRGVSKKWQKQEETILLSILSQNNYLLTPNGKNIKWNEASLKLYFSSNRVYFRHPKQIREHWINHLDPQITKQNWTLEQDSNLIKYVIELGKKWALIAKSEGRRTEHMIKNRFRAIMRKQQNCFSNVANEMQLLNLIKYKYELCKFGQPSCTKMISFDSKLEPFEEEVFCTGT